ncbi:MAG: septum formation initiator family protein [Firmicutes bacterium]|nr:septum formation initiator family protein [Bacillota bacterium]
MKNMSMNFFVKAAILVLAAFCVVTIVRLQFEFNDLREQENELKAKIEASRDHIEEIQNDLDAPFDEEYIVRVAREKLNYYLPEEIIFYSDR